MKTGLSLLLSLLCVLSPSLPGQGPPGAAVVEGKARFSLLGEGILRVEYAPGGNFDDRPTFRCISMPAPGPFSRVERKGKTLFLEGGGIRVRYSPDGKPPGPSNLTVSWKAGGMEGRWSPGDVDPRNLGSLFTMDHLARGMIPHGVHPAGLDRSDRYGEYNLVHAWINVDREIREHPDLYKGIRLDFSSFFREFDSLPEGLKKVASMWLEFPPGAVSASGWTVMDETGMAFYDPKTRWIDTRLRPDYVNLFFCCYGRDYLKAMKQFTALCGKIPLLPRWAFGSWYSCWQQYSAADHERILEEYQKNRIPLDVLIIDMEWHVKGWNGWEWNKKLYPDLPGFFGRLKERGIHVALNLHDETISRKDRHFQEICRRLGVGTDVADPKNVRILPAPGSWVLDFTNPKVWEAVRDVCYVPNEKLGVSFWWLDNWQGRQDGYNSVLWIDHLAFRHMEEDLGRRPIILGRYSGFGTHRYGACFTGDTASQWEILAHELEVNARSAQVGMAYLSHDLGGFKGPWPGVTLPRIDPEMYIRWMQMGALSPIMRVHSNHGTREPWEYGKNVLRIVRKAYELHTELVPFFYHLARQAYDEGAPILRPLWFHFPGDGACFEHPGEYMLGGKILAAPVAKAGGKRRFYLPAGKWWNLSTGKLLQGPRAWEEYTDLDEIPLFVRAGSLVPAQDPVLRVGTKLPDPLVLRVYPGGEDALDLYEDEGDGLGYRKGAFTRWPFRLASGAGRIRLAVGPMRGDFPGKPASRNLRVEVYFWGKPAKVLLDGKALEEGAGWSFRKKENILVLPLEGLDTGKKREILIAKEV